MKNWVSELARKKFYQDQSHYSQSYQDVLIDEIFSNIETENDPPFCVEFGFNENSLTGGSGANVARLVLDHNWDCLLLDGNNENTDINLRKHFLTPDNICQIFQNYEVPKIPEYISIDVDSIDLWLFERLLKEYRAMVFSVEYNSHFDLKASITFPNDVNQLWEGDRGYGASLKALTTLANCHGYSLLWVVPYLDAFFIRNDLIDDGSKELVPPFATWSECTNVTLHPPLKNEARLHMFVNYDKFVSTGGDLALSKKSAYVTCRAFLTDSMDIKSTRRRGIKRAVKDFAKLGRKLVKNTRRYTKSLFKRSRGSEP